MTELYARCIFADENMADFPGRCETVYVGVDDVLDAVDWFAIAIFYP